MFWGLRGGPGIGWEVTGFREEQAQWVDKTSGFTDLGTLVTFNLLRLTPAVGTGVRRRSQGSPAPPSTSGTTVEGRLLS